jgi:hypothetical protein
MSELLEGLDAIQVYIDDIPHMTKGSWQENLDLLEDVFNRLRQAGLKVNAKKSSFGAHELKYLGYLITPTGISPITKKVKAIHAINRFPGKRLFQYALSPEIRIIRQAVSLPKTCLKSKTQVRIL